MPLSSQDFYALTVQAGDDRIRRRITEELNSSKCSGEIELALFDVMGTIPFRFIWVQDFGTV